MSAVRQNTPEWIAARRDGIGSSDIPIIAGESPYRSPYALWAEKVGLVAPEEPDAEQAELYEIGHLLEDDLLEIYERRTGRHAKRAPLMRSHPRLPWAHASLDATAPVRRVVEAKWSNASRWGNDGVPDDVRLQVQWQLFVTGWDVADVVALVGRRPRIVEVPRDAALMDEVVAIATDFWRLVVTRTPPLIDGSDATRRAINARRPASLAPALTPTPELVQIVDAYVEAKAAAATAENAAATAGNALRAVIGDADGIAGLVTYRRNADSRRVNWPAVAAAYRGLLSDRPSADLDVIESIHTTTSEGAPVLRLSRGDAA